MFRLRRAILNVIRCEEPEGNDRLTNSFGLSLGEALRNAQLNMLKSTDRSHPYYWASFIQIGDWRKLEVGGPTPSLQR